jgi:hypothetical protein
VLWHDLLDLARGPNTFARASLQDGLQTKKIFFFVRKNGKHLEAYIEEKEDANAFASISSYTASPDY